MTQTRSLLLAVALGLLLLVLAIWFGWAPWEPSDTPHHFF